MAAKQTVEQVLRDLEREERKRGLLAMGTAAQKGGLLASAAAASLQQPVADTVKAAVGAKPNIGNGADSMLPAEPTRSAAPGLLGTTLRRAETGARRGLLSPNPTEGLLSPTPRQMAEQPQERGLPSKAGNFLDDLLFGGAVGDRRAERRDRERAEGQRVAHNEAFAESMAGGAFDPAIYGQAMARRGFAPDMESVVRLEGVTDSQDVRGARGRQERREVTGGALAPLLRADDAGRASALPGVMEYLQSQGMPYEGPTNPAALSSAVGAGMGANAYLDNDRGERALAENIRSNMAGEDYRSRDFGFRKEVDNRNFGYQRERDRADDAYRYSRAEAEDTYRQWQMENDLSRSDVEGRVLRKAIEQGSANLTPEERAVYDRAVTVQGGFGWGGMPAAAPGAPGVAPPAPTAPAQQPQRGGDGRSPQAPATPTNEADFDRLPAGAWFINPADGRVMQKER